ncbi:MAG: chromate transporter [Erysipelotrichaceae bacterium]|nr:chromate transporter [Erysipelotrichaceae bacterium]
MISILEIFLSFLKIGLFAFGGAYAVIPLIEQQIVRTMGWMSFREFSDLLAIDELTPGPIIINSSTFIGMKLAGIKGALSATFGCMLPGCIISLLLVVIYKKYKKIPIISEIMSILKCMSVALIFSVLLKMFLSTIFPDGIALDGIDIPALVMMVASFFVLKKYKPNPILVMLACGALTLVLSYLPI